MLLGYNMRAAPITTTDIRDIEEKIRTNCAIYTDQVQFGVETALNAVLELIVEQSYVVDEIGLEGVYKLIDESTWP